MVDEPNSVMEFFERRIEWAERAMAEAHGADSLSATLTNALTVENQFSFVNAIAVVAV
jgi:hypothetical protein